MRARAVENPSDPGTRRVARFVESHEACGGRFEVLRQRGGGQGSVRIACEVCGAAADCDPSKPGLLRLAREPGARAKRKPLVSAEELQKWLPAPAALPWWVPNAYIGVIIAAGVALIAFGLVAPIDREEPVVLAPPPTPPPQGGLPAPQPVQPAPPVNTGPLGAGGVAVDPPEQGIAAPIAAPQWVKRRAKTLNRIEVAGSFAISLPAGWIGGTSDGAVVFYGPNGDAELRVFLERGPTELDELTARARSYLSDRRPGADILGPEALRIGRSPAQVLLARYDGGAERAVLLRSNGIAFLVLGNIDGSASKGLENDALAALSSFRPL